MSKSTPPRISATGFVLAGGQSSRMGSDKALVLFNGQPLMQRAVEALHAAHLEPRIAGARSDLSAFAPVVPDENITGSNPEIGPLAGVLSALSTTPTELNLFLPVDMPLMPPSLLACLTERAARTGAPVTVVQLNGRIEPFPVVLRGTVLTALRHRVAAGETGCQSAWLAIPSVLNAELDAPHVEALVQFGLCAHPDHLPPFRWFQSANTPHELDELGRILRQRRADLA